MIGARMNGVLGEIALCNIDLTAATNASSAADQSRSTPSARAASSRLAPSANSPRLPEGVKTMRWVKRSTGPNHSVAGWPSYRVMPAEAGIHERDVLSGKTFATAWTPAFAGVTYGAVDAQLARHAGFSRPSCLARTARRCVSYSSSSRAAEPSASLPDRRRKAPARRAAIRRDRRRRSWRRHASPPRRSRG